MRIAVPAPAGRSRSVVVLEGIVVRLTGPDLDHVFYVVQENFAVHLVAGAEGLLRRHYQAGPTLDTTMSAWILGSRFMLILNGSSEKDAVVVGLYQNPNRSPAERIRFGKEEQGGGRMTSFLPQV